MSGGKGANLKTTTTKNHNKTMGFPDSSVGKESACDAGDPGSIPGSGRKRDSLPTPVFWSEEFHGLYSSWGRKESDQTEPLSKKSNVNP